MVELANPQEPALPPASRALRIWYCCFQATSLSVLGAVCWAARGYEDIYKQLGMTRLPVPTELLLSAARLVRDYPYVVPIIGLILIVLALGGKLDRGLINLIVINCIWTILMIAFGYLSLHLPIAQIQEALESK